MAKIWSGVNLVLTHGIYHVYTLALF